MKAINLEANDTTYLLSIDKNAIDKEVLTELVERIRLEYLIKKPILAKILKNSVKKLKRSSGQDKQGLLGDEV